MASKRCRPVDYYWKQYADPIGHGIMYRRAAVLLLQWHHWSADWCGYTVCADPDE